MTVCIPYKVHKVEGLIDYVGFSTGYIRLIPLDQVTFLIIQTTVIDSSRPIPTSMVHKVS